MFFGKILQFFYGITNDYALSIVLFTIITRLILLPLTFQQMRSMNAMKIIQPQIDEINKKYKGNPQKQGEMLQKLYKEYKINPAAGCLPLLIQFPIMIAMYGVVQQPVKYVFGTEALYKAADRGFFWLHSISVPDVINMGGFKAPFILPILAAIATYFSIEMSIAKSNSSGQGNEMAQSMNKSMKIMMPLMTLWMGITFPAALVLYWFIGTLVQIIQQYLIGKFEYHMDFLHPENTPTPPKASQIEREKARRLKEKNQDQNDRVRQKLIKTNKDEKPSNVKKTTTKTREVKDNKDK